jgi:hypothetical protein
MREKRRGGKRILQYTNKKGIQYYYTPRVTKTK